MPIRIDRTPGGSTSEPTRFVYVGNVQIPLPPTDASPRQLLDFAAIVGLEGREGGSAAIAEVTARVARVYLAEYGA